jgi:hypothetical protein
MEKQGYGSDEKHFPSRVCLQLTPLLQSDILSVTVRKSTDNPVHEVGMQKTIENSFEPPKSIGLSISSSETIVLSLKPWKFEQLVYGDSAILNWILHDGVNGRMVFSSKPPKSAFCRPKSWFQDRYNRAHRPFTREGGVIFAEDEHMDTVCWNVGSSYRKNSGLGDKRKDLVDILAEQAKDPLQ